MSKLTFEKEEPIKIFPNSSSIIKKRSISERVSRALAEHKFYLNQIVTA